MSEGDRAGDDMEDAPIGERLRAARVAKGLSLDDVSAATRVRLRHLQAIEAGDMAPLPVGPYSVGFVRSYARLVDIDPADAGEAFRLERDAAMLPPVDTISYEPADPARLPSRGVAWAAAAIAVLLIAAYALFRAGVFGGDGAEDVARLAAGTDRPTVAAPSAAAPAAVTPAPPPPQATRQVVLTAIEPVWIRIYQPGGSTLFQGELAAGQSYDVPPGTPAPLIRLGRAEALRVTVGGVEMAPLGPPARTLRDVSLAADALRPLAPPSPSAPR